MNNKTPFRSIAIYTTILTQLAGSMLIGIFGGLALDKRLSTMPLFLVVGLLAGLFAGVYAMFRTLHYFNSGD